MTTIPYYVIILTVIFILVMIVIISSVGYNEVNTDDTVKATLKSLSKKKDIEITTLKNAFSNNCHILDIPKLDKNIGYSIVGNFNSSYITIYDKNENIKYSKNLNGELNVVISSNRNILTPLFKLSKFKGITIPIQNDENYKIVIDKIENINIQKYVVNYDIDFKEMENIKGINVGLTEYDLDLYVRKNIRGILNKNTKSLEDIEVQRVYPKSENSFSKWYFNAEGSYVIAMVKNLYNYDISLNNEHIQNRKNTNTPELEIINVQNPKISIQNLDYVENKKDINTEYIDFISTPNDLLDIYLNGKVPKKINYTQYINNKVLIYKI